MLGRDEGQREGRAELLQPTLGTGQGPSQGRKGPGGGRGTALGSGSEDAAVQTRMLGWGELGSQALKVVPAVHPRDTHPRVPGWGVMPLAWGGGTPLIATDTSGRMDWPVATMP